MNRYPKYLLPLFLIFCLIFLVSCFAPVIDSTKGTIQGRIMIPDSSTKDITGWIPLPNAIVTVTDSEGITHTVTTDSEGYYSFFDLPPGTNYIITATGQVGENTVILKDLIPLVEEGENYDAGTADCESTALPLVIEALLAEGLTLEEIDLEQIQNTDNFPSLISAICLLLESYGDVTSDSAIANLVEEVVEEIIPSPPAPYVPSNDATLSDLTVNGVTVSGFNPSTLIYNHELPYGTTVVPTVGATTNDSNASKVITQATSVTGTATVVVTAEDGTTQKIYTVNFSVALNDAKEIEEFWFEEDDDPAFDGYIDGDINATLYTVSLAVPYGTDVTDLTAYFELSDEASATVGVTPQVSGVTMNDFTLPIIYTITAENGSTQNWEVTVSEDPPKTTTDIEEYEFTKADNPALSYDVEGTINYTSHTVSLTAPYGTRNSLVAAFELAAGASATVGGTPQVSGVTANDFTSPVTYTVTAQDGITTQDWIVTVGEETVRYVATAANGGNDSNDGSESSPWLTIQHALDTAPDLGTIIVKDDGPYNETINPPSTSDTDGGRVIILKNASGATPVINGESGACTVGMYGCPEGTAMEGFTITHASGVSGKGIYIRDGSQVSINNCTISNNDTQGGAGGLWVDIGTNFVTLNDCTISNNTADGSGGGIYLGSQNSSLTLNNCTISGNQADSGNGGGIHKGTGTLIINGGTISGNSTSSGGGGIYNEVGGALTIDDAVISGNSASSSGGGIYNIGGIMTVKGCTISNNKAATNFSAGICLTGPLSYNFIGGSGADMNFICGNYITGYSSTLDDQIGTGTSSLDGTYSSTNDIYVNCACDFDSLSALSLSTGILAPTFDCDTINYTATVVNNITSITVTPTANYSGAAITVEGESVTSGSASDDIDLVVGVNTITTAVTAQSETTTYTVTVTRELAVGDSYGGGIVAYILQSGDPGYDVGEQHGLIAATADYGNFRPWSDVTSTLLGTTYTAIGTGQANTTAIIGQPGHSNSAAWVCDFYSVTVDSVLYNDWFLPSKDELNKLYLNKAAIGGFADNWYWSSSEYNYYCAWRQNFAAAITDADWLYKDNTLKVRPVRAF